MQPIRLWFDVGIKRYTTSSEELLDIQKLWFDVGIKRYTTKVNGCITRKRCGLM